MNNQLLATILKAVPCSERKGLLCEAKYSFWAQCCSVIKAIKSEGQPIEIQELDDNQLHIMLYKRPEAIRESYGVVTLVEPVNRLFPKYKSYNLT